MSIVKEESFILEDMKKAFKKNKKFDYQLYCECKKMCYVYGIEQLYHAKAVLEEKQTFASDNNNGISVVFSIITIALTTITLWVSALTDNRKKDLPLDSLLAYGLIVAIAMVILLILHNMVIIYHRKDAYFYSIICDEIERRKSECQNK